MPLPRFLARRKAQKADRQFLAGLQRVRAAPDFASKYSAPRQDYVDFQIRAFTWWLERGMGKTLLPPSENGLAPRDQILLRWADAHPDEVDMARVRRAMMAQRTSLQAGGAC